MYKVIHEFADLEDEKHLYKIGERYPRNGVIASSERISVLTSNRNKAGKPLIEKVLEATEEKSKEPTETDDSMERHKKNRRNSKK